MCKGIGEDNIGSHDVLSVGRVEYQRERIDIGRREIKSAGEAKISARET
ncbi:hypothetical protein [Oceanobacillus arenosus]|nr:hypothetical protein [Oceanobacillus arenosus]